MFKIVQGRTRGLSDTAAFIETLAEHEKFFPADEGIYITRAPGRLDVMGGIADYSGSMVLQMPTHEATFAALQKNSSGEVKIFSLTTDDKKSDRSFTMPLADLYPGGKLISYKAAHEYFRRNARDHWAAYVIGTFIVLGHEEGIAFQNGTHILIDSNVPPGKGVSSSAAIEVAVMNAVCGAYDIMIAPRELAILCQKVENLVVGAPCGIMDQMASQCGSAHRLMAMTCRPAEILPSKIIPPDIAFWGIDSGIRHSVGAGDYGSVRTGAFIGYRIIAEIAGLKVSYTNTPGKVAIDDPKWNGYLANITPEEFEKDLAYFLPENISGAEFLERYGGITDHVTTVHPEKVYAVRKPAAHPIYENARVKQFADLLEKPMTEDVEKKLGWLMYLSHESYSACGLGSPGTDLLVELAKDTRELYGAKITGGGSGGTVVILGKAGAEDAVKNVAREYGKRIKYRPHVFAGSSPGAGEFGCLKLVKV